MGNICINTLNAEGAPSQVDELVGKLSVCFENHLDINDVFAIEFKATASITISSQWKMPQKELLKITSSLSDTQGLYIRVTAEEPGEEYFEQIVFTEGKWSFENPPGITSRILELKSKGLDEIRKKLTANGQINFGEDNNVSALYINDDGYAECPYFKYIELETNGKISVLLSDWHWLSEEELTTDHVVDLLILMKIDTDE